jgi:hypothetical protein
MRESARRGVVVPAGAGCRGGPGLAWRDSPAVVAECDDVDRGAGLGERRSLSSRSWLSGSRTPFFWMARCGCRRVARTCDGLGLERAEVLCRRSNGS